MLEKTFEKHHEVYKDSQSVYSQPSFLFYKDSVIKSGERTQQGDLFSDSIQDLIDSLESKINLWYLDDGNLSDDYRTVLKDLKKIFEAEKTLGLKSIPTESDFFPWWHHWNTTIDNFSIFPKTHRSLLTARPEITSRIIGKEN